MSETIAESWQKDIERIAQLEAEYQSEQADKEVLLEENRQLRQALECPACKALHKLHIGGQP